MMHKALPVKKIATKVIVQMLLGGIAGMCSTGVIMSFHKEIGAAANLCSLHSWLGIVTLTLFPIYSFSLFWMVYRDGAEELRLPVSWVGPVCLGLGINSIPAFSSLVTGWLKKLTFLQKEKAWEFRTKPLTVSLAAIAVVSTVVLFVSIKPKVEKAQENGDDGLPI